MRQVYFRQVLFNNQIQVFLSAGSLVLLRLTPNTSFEIFKQQHHTITVRRRITRTHIMTVVFCSIHDKRFHLVLIAYLFSSWVKLNNIY